LSGGVITVIPAADWCRMPWKNGLGETTEIAVEGDGDGFLWRVSIADVAQSGRFSDYPDVQRWITVLSGAGMRLLVGDAAPLVVRALDTPVCFAGDVETQCELLDGAIQDFNFMLDRRRVGGRMEVVNGPLSVEPSWGVILVHAVTLGVVVSVPGGAAVMLAAKDTAVVRVAGSRVALEDGATAILVCIEPAVG
jgi:environmental stress-induced protein Ves